MALEHIKIPNVGTRIVYNVAVGTPSVTIPFAFFSASDIVVTSNGAPLTLGVNFNVIGTGGYDKGFPGGTVVFLQPPIIPTVIVVERLLPIERLVDFPNSGPLQTAALNTELDKGVAIDQQLKGDINALDARIDILELGDPRLGRAMLFPPEDLALNHSLPAIPARSNRTLGFATDGNIEMRSAITLPDVPHDEMLPPAAGRINKVLGWDVSGFNVNLVEVVAGSIVPNADNISYTAVPGTTVTRSVGNVLRERLSIKDFGTQVGEGVQANDDAALAAAITYINSAPSVGLTLFYPAGVYFHGPCPVKLTRTYCTIEGDGTNSAFVMFSGPGTWLTLGDTTAAAASENISFRNFTLQLQTAAGRFFLLEKTVHCRFENIRLVSAEVFATLGVTGATPSTAFHTYIRNCGGTSRNTGSALIQCRNGAGLYIDLCNFVVDSAVAGGISGKNFIEFTTVSTFSVVRVTTCFVVSYYAACLIDLSSGGAVSDIIFNSCSLVSLASFGLFLSSPPGASITGVRASLCVIGTPNGTGIWLIGSGRNDEHNFINNGFIESGGSAIAGNSSALHIVIAGNRIKNCNRLNIAQAAIHLTAGSGFNVDGNVGNDAESTSRAPWGIIMGAGMDRYLVSNNRIGGTVGSVKAEPDGVASHLRRIVNNGFAWSQYNGYATIVAVGVDPSGNYTNNTPFVCDVIVSGSGFAGTTAINGIPIGVATTGTFHLEPGDVLNVQNQGANLTQRIHE